MNKSIVYILSIFLIGWLFGMGWCHNATCPDCQTAKAALPPSGPAISLPDLSLTIEDPALGFRYSVPDNLLFEKNECNFSRPISSELQDLFQNTIRHLNEFSDRVLVVKGLYGLDENNSCDAADPGLARAENLRSLLIELGGPPERIELEPSGLKVLEKYGDSLLTDGFAYRFKDLEVAEILRADKITLQFETSKQEIRLNEEQQIYFERLRTFLQNNPNAKALVTGHTDDRGTDQGNIRLSRKRSEFVRDYMTEQGISKKQIINKGLGPDYPVATNSTFEGRARNRRVEITLQ